MRISTLTRVVLGFELVLTTSACFPCKDGSTPKAGSCVCDDGTQLNADECPACDGASTEQLDRAAAQSLSGSTLRDCPREYKLEVDEPSLLSLALTGMGGTVGLRVTDTKHSASYGSLSASSSEVNAELPLDRGSYVIMLENSSSTAVKFTSSSTWQATAAPGRTLMRAGRRSRRQPTSATSPSSSAEAAG